MAVTHQPRVALDCARAFVTAAGGDGFDAFADRVVALLGTEFYGELTNTRAHLLTAKDQQVHDVELGRWRVRFEDLLRTRPDLTAVLRELA